jgi:hypothetical protein
LPSPIAIVGTRFGQSARALFSQEILRRSSRLTRTLAIDSYTARQKRTSEVEPARGRRTSRALFSQSRRP